ncbi:MAG: cytosine deaminase [Myxococcota bacterium]
MAEPHVHLDAALLGARRPNRSGTLREGIANWAALRANHRRGRRRARAAHRRDVRRDRRAADPHPRRRRIAAGGRGAGGARPGDGRARHRPAGGRLPAGGHPARARAARGLEAAVAAGCHAVGAIPHFERTTEEGWESVRLAFALAEQHGRMLDFHCDETDDPGSRNLEVVCAETADRGLAGSVIAGHCTALHSYPNPYAAKVCELVAASGVQVVCNPLDNVVLQGRYDSYPRRRGLTRVDQLWAAGATVGVGHDSVQDPWYRLGTGNLLDAAYMLVHVGHLTGEDDMARVFDALIGANHGPWGGPPALSEGATGACLWWPSADPVDLLRDRPRPLVLR